MNPIADLLARQPSVILDGALATELEARGCDLRDPLWSAKVLIEQPELIRAVHYDYFLAGADCATTASYQASFAGFAARGFSHAESIGLMQRSVSLALEARDAFWAEPARRQSRSKPFVAASIGPYGASLADGSEYRGDYDRNEAALMDFHRERMAVLIAAGAEMLACETLPCLAEARAIARLLPEFPGISAWISFSARDGAHNSQGEKLADCVAELAGQAQIAAIGINCTAPQHIPALVAAARTHSGATPILVYPNSGEQYDPVHKHWHGTATPTAFADAALLWQAAGASVIGGCCRTGPADIAALATRLRTA